MRQEVIDFYDAMKIPVERMVQVGVRRKGLDADSVRESAEKVYEDIKNGMEIRQIRIAWEVYGRSKPERIRSNRLADVYVKVESIEKKLDEHMMPWYKKLWRWLT